jgi:hypothetical protein
LRRTSLFVLPPPSWVAPPPPNSAVLCALPGTHRLATVLPSQPFAPATVIGGASSGIGYAKFTVKTPWVEFPHAYTGGCVVSNGAHVLEIKAQPGAPTLHPIPDPTWGLHLTDANIALGNLVNTVAAEIKAFFKRHP